MFEKKQMLPIGSKVTVCYALDGGTETVLVVVGHLSLRNKNTCHYDYVCVTYPNGLEDGIRYINHSDIVRVICCADETDEAYIKWREKKYVEYKVYYENYDPERRADIDTMREQVAQWKRELEECERHTLKGKAVNIAIIILGAGVTVLLTGNWWAGLCAFVLASFIFVRK